MSIGRQWERAGKRTAKKMRLLFILFGTLCYWLRAVKYELYMRSWFKLLFFHVLFSRLRFVSFRYGVVVAAGALVLVVLIFCCYCCCCSCCCCSVFCSSITCTPPRCLSLSLRSVGACNLMHSHIIFILDDGNECMFTTHVHVRAVCAAH